jgi:hypothetical protein
MTIRRLVLTLFAAALVGVTLTACGTAATSGGSNGRELSETTQDSAGSRDEADDYELPEPPGSTLSHGGETVSAGLGSYCWVSVCADTFAMPVSEEVLTVPAGSSLTFAYGGKKLDSLSVSAHRIGQKDRLKRMAGGIFLMPDEESKGYERIRLPTRRSGTRARVAAKLPAGEYAVEALARFPEGDALYGFRVVVE